MNIFSTVNDSINEFSLLEKKDNKNIIRGIRTGPGIEISLLDADKNQISDEKLLFISQLDGGLSLSINNVELAKPLTSLNVNVSNSTYTVSGNSVSLNLTNTELLNAGSGAFIVRDKIDNNYNLRSLYPGHNITLLTDTQHILVQANNNKVHHVTVVNGTFEYNINKNDHIIIVRQNIPGPTLITLPPGSINQTFTIKDGLGDSNNNPITIVSIVGELIDGQPNIIINYPYESITVVWNGVDWNII